MTEVRQRLPSPRCQQREIGDRTSSIQDIQGSWECFGADSEYRLRIASTGLGP